MVNEFEYFIILIISVTLILGCYNVYFYIQRKKIKKSKTIIKYLAYFDEKIPFRPSWVWIYSGLYYPVILFLAIKIDSYKDFVYTSFNFITLLFFQVIFFYTIPIKTPENWRCYNPSESLSSKMLSFVQKYDNQGNCFPSMHVSVATLVAFHLKTHSDLVLGGWDFTYIYILFPVLIGVSTLFTKQHYIIDVFGGFLLGYVCYFIQSIYRFN